MLVQLKGTHTLVWFDPALHFESRLHNWKTKKHKSKLEKDQRVLEKLRLEFKKKHTQ